MSGLLGMIESGVQEVKHIAHPDAVPAKEEEVSAGQGGSLGDEDGDMVGEISGSMGSGLGGNEVGLEGKHEEPYSYME